MSNLNIDLAKPKENSLWLHVKFNGDTIHYIVEEHGGQWVAIEDNWDPDTRSGTYSEHPSDSMHAALSHVYNEINLNCDTAEAENLIPENDFINQVTEKFEKLEIRDRVPIDTTKENER